MKRVANFIRPAYIVTSPISTNKLTINISKKLGFPIERVEKDLSVYQGSVDKLKQAIELIKFLNKSD